MHIQYGNKRCQTSHQNGIAKRYAPFLFCAGCDRTVEARCAKFLRTTYGDGDDNNDDDDHDVGDDQTDKTTHYLAFSVSYLFFVVSKKPVSKSTRPTICDQRSRSLLQVPSSLQEWVVPAGSSQAKSRFFFGRAPLHSMCCGQSIPGRQRGGGHGDVSELEDWESQEPASAGSCLIL